MWGGMYVQDLKSEPLGTVVRRAFAHRAPTRRSVKRTLHRLFRVSVSSPRPRVLSYSSLDVQEATRLGQPYKPAPRERLAMSAWAGLVSSHLSRWRAASFSSEDVDRAEAWVSVTGRKMLTVPGAWRAKVINGSVYVKLLHAAPTWEERASVLRMLLMLTNRAGPPLPDVDFVYASSDQDPAPSHTQVLFLSNAIELKALKSSLPVPEFTWVGWKLQLPWCQLLARLRLEASRHTWKERRDKLFFSGSLDNGRWRRRLRMLHKQQEPDGDLHIHHVRSDFFHFSTSSEASRSREAARAAQQGAAAARTRMEAPCAFRYALSIPGFGYARAGSICHCYTRAMRIPCDTACRYSSRLKSLLACGCAVVPSSGLRRRGRPRQRQRPTAIRSQPLQSPASRHTASPSKVIANLRIRGTYDLPTHSHRYTSRRRGTSSSRRCSSTASTGSRCNTPTSGITSVDSPPLCTCIPPAGAARPGHARLIPRFSPSDFTITPAGAARPPDPSRPAGAACQPEPRAQPGPQRPPLRAPHVALREGAGILSGAVGGTRGKTAAVGRPDLRI